MYPTPLLFYPAMATCLGIAKSVDAIYTIHPATPHALETKPNSPPGLLHVLAEYGEIIIRYQIDDESVQSS